MYPYNADESTSMVGRPSGPHESISILCASDIRRTLDQETERLEVKLNISKTLKSLIHLNIKVGSWEALA